MRQAGVDLGVVGQVRAIRNARAAVGRGLARRQIEVRPQTGSQEKVRTQTRVAPQIRESAGSGLLLLVIEVNVIVRDVGQIRGGEIELRRIDLLALGALRGQVQIGRQVARGVINRELGPVLFPVAVVEGRQNDGRAELTLVDQIFRLLVIGVESNGQFAGDLLLNAEAVVVRS